MRHLITEPQDAFVGPTPADWEEFHAYICECEQREEEEAFEDANLELMAMMECPV